MSKTLITILLSIFCITTAMAVEPQTNKPRKFNHKAYAEEMHQFVSREAKLSAEEAKRFFAIYDELRNKERQLFKANRAHKKQRPNTDEECRRAIVEHDNIELQLKKLQQQYHLRILEAISPMKAFEAIMAAERFDEMKFQDMSRKGGAMPPAPGGGGPRGQGGPGMRR